MKKTTIKGKARINGVCPSCKTMTHYTFLGVQRWPEEVAKRLGVATEQSMWQCNTCKTSVMEDSIGADDTPITA